MSTLGSLAASLGVSLKGGDPDTLVADIQYDSRKVAPGCLFVALRGGYFDGHDYVAEAVGRGAVAVAVEHPVAGVASLQLPDTREALPSLAASFFDYPASELTLIGITGTDGKSTTTHMVESIFHQNGRSTGVIGTIAIKIRGEVVESETRQTTPESLDIQRYLDQMRRSGVEWGVLEATSHGLATHRLSGIPFQIGGVTNITHEHLDFHGTLENYRRAKARLFETVGAEGGWAVVNMDDMHASRMDEWASGAQVITYGIESEHVDIRAINVDADMHGSAFALVADGSVRDARVPLPGRFNVENCLCAIGIALASGLSLDRIVESLPKIPPAPGRMTPVDAGQPFDVFVDYAHTPESMTRVLDLCRTLKPTGRLICVSGSAGERDREKRPLQGGASVSIADYSVFTTEDPRFENPETIIDEIAAGALEAGAVEGYDFVKIIDRQEAINYAIGRASPGDTVILVGKGHEKSIIWGVDKRPWDEFRSAEIALKEIGYETS